MADPLVISGLLSLGKAAIDKIFPNPEKRAEATLKLEKLAQEGKLAELQAEIQLLTGQIEINKIEAASDSLFKSGWRPAVGWVCVLGLFYTFVARPFLVWALMLNGVLETPPALDMGDLITLLMGLLGLGGLRTMEKFRGVAAK